MRIIQKGFSLIECLIYCALTMLLGVLLFNWMSSTQAALKRSCRHCELLVDRIGIFDTWSADIAMAPSENVFWKKIASTMLVWQGSEMDIGWQLEGRSLYRITGYYTNGVWSKVTKSLISNTIGQASFGVSRNATGDVESAVLSCDNHKQKILVCGSKKYYEHA